MSNSIKKEVCQWAFLSEKILHGTPSGIDNSVSTYGGMCKFSQGIVDDVKSNAKVTVVNAKMFDIIREIKETYWTKIC